MEDDEIRALRPDRPGRLAIVMSQEIALRVVRRTFADFEYKIKFKFDRIPLGCLLFMKELELGVNDELLS